jgi:hypothetical protein
LLSQKRDLLRKIREKVTTSKTYREICRAPKKWAVLKPIFVKTNPVKYAELLAAGAIEEVKKTRLGVSGIWVQFLQACGLPGFTWPRVRPD